MVDFIRKGSCIRTLIERTPLRAIKCPLCRQNISLIMMSEELRSSQNQEKQQIVSRLRSYNTRFSSEMSLSYVLCNLPFLFSLTLRTLSDPRAVRVVFGLGKLSLYVLGMLLYLVSPFDLVPEAVWGVIGLLDDILFLGLLLLFVAAQVYRVVRRNNLNN